MHDLLKSDNITVVTKLFQSIVDKGLLGKIIPLITQENQNTTPVGRNDDDYDDENREFSSTEIIL